VPGNGLLFVVVDELHDEFLGEFRTREEAIAELQRRADIPWDQPPNLAPCTNWENCGRRYELIEYDNSMPPQTEISRRQMLEINKKGVRWIGGFSRT
jgi:hypothetical protein